MKHARELTLKVVINSSRDEVRNYQAQCSCENVYPNLNLIPKSHWWVIFMLIAIDNMLMSSSKFSERHSSCIKLAMIKKIKKTMYVKPEIFPACGQVPYHGTSVGLGCLTAVHKCRAVAGSESGSASGSFFLCNMRAREVCIVVGQGARNYQIEWKGS